VPRRKPTLRRYLSAPFRALPSYLIIGAQRSGTTTLHALLARHPQIVWPLRKEVRYFDRRHLPGSLVYRAYFPLRSELGDGQITGEATATLLYTAQAPRRVHHLLPEARLIALLRDPVARAHSHYEYNRRFFGEPAATFEEAIDDEPRRLPSPGAQPLEEIYLARSRYAEQVERWLAIFPREQLLVVRSEDLYAAPAAVASDVAVWLGLDPYEPESMWRNETPGKEALAPETEARLRRYFQPHNERLYELIGRDLGWPLSPEG
jgi:hypothetical protein